MARCVEHCQNRTSLFAILMPRLDNPLGIFATRRRGPMVKYALGVYLNGQV